MTFIQVGTDRLMVWDQRFLDPIILSKGKALVTLSVATNYILKPSKAERDAQQWQTAAELLMLIGENGGDPMMAHNATMQALNRHFERVFDTSRKETLWDTAPAPSARSWRGFGGLVLLARRYAH